MTRATLTDGTRPGRRRPSPLALLGALFILGASGVAFHRLGFSPPGTLALLAAIALGTRLRLPIARGRVGVDLNVGGGLVPLGVAALQAAWLPESARVPTLGATAAVAALCFGLARRTGSAVVLPWALPALLGAALALVMEPARAARVAYVAGTAGPLLGADLPRLGTLGRVASIGGDGLFDGLLWTGVLAACLV